MLTYRYSYRLVREIVRKSRRTSPECVAYGRIIIVCLPVKTAVFPTPRTRTHWFSGMTIHRQREKLPALAWPHRDDGGTDASPPSKGLAPTTWDVDLSFPR